MASATGKGQGPAVAVIGAGMVGDIHLAAIAATGGAVRLRGVLSRQGDSARALLARNAAFQDARVYGSLDEVEADDGVDVCILLTPPNARVDLVATLAAAHKPILMEKPLARDLAEATRVVEICEAASLVTGVVFQHRFRAASLKAKALVDSGTLGPLAMADIAVPWWRPQSYYDEPGRGTYARDGGGVLISQAIHTIDLALSLTGPVASVQAMTATTAQHAMEAEDFAVAGLRFASGAVGALVANTASYPGLPETIALHFAAASLRLHAGVLTVSWRDGREERFGETAATGGGADPMAFTHEWHQSVLEDFVAALAGGHDPAVTARGALVSHQLIDAIERSAKAGSVVAIEG